MIDQAVDDVLDEIERARAAQDFTQAQEAVMRSRIQLGAVAAYSEARGAHTAVSSRPPWRRVLLRRPPRATPFPRREERTG
jgi:hypothetical protein